MGAGDLDGRGGAWVVFGPFEDGAVLDDSPVVLLASDGFYASGDMQVAVPGDVDGDGLGDAVLAEQWSSEAGEIAGGEIWLFTGLSPGTWSFDDATARLYGTRQCGMGGADVTGAGDVNADGFADLWVGSPGVPADDGDCPQDPGHVSLILGPVVGRYWLDQLDAIFRGANGLGATLSADEEGLLVGVDLANRRLGLLERPWE